MFPTTTIFFTGTNADQAALGQSFLDYDEAVEYADKSGLRVYAVEGVIDFSELREV